MNIIPEIKPTKSQQEGLDKLKRFLKSDEPFFILVGPAGSGKTTMLKLGLKDLLEEPRQNSSDPNVWGITVAHQAKNVLKQSVRQVATFAKAYGFKEEYDEVTGVRRFVPVDRKYLKEPPVAYMGSPVYVHDEVSMYSYEMKDIIIKNRSPFSKIIFVGDNAQLPPIDPKMKVDEDSPIFNLPVPEWCKHTLTERVRQKEGNPILDLSDIVREEIFGSQNLNRIIEKIITPKIVDGCGYDLIEESQLYPYYIANSYGDFLNNKIIAFRKNTVHKINTDVRNILFKNSPQSLLPGDIVCLTENFMVDDGLRKFKLENSQNFKIHEVENFDLISLYVDFSIPCHYGFIDSQKQRYIIVPTTEGKLLYQQAIEQLLRNASFNGKEWKSFWEFKGLFTEHTMGYAVNAYRSQGSTYENVYVDLVDILSVKPLTVKRKLQTIYTAITRPKRNVKFIKP